MCQNYVIVEASKLLQRRRFSLLTMICLSTGVACTLLTFFWVKDELHPGRQSRQQPLQCCSTKNTATETDLKTWDGTPGFLGRILKEETPEVVHAVSSASDLLCPLKSIIGCNISNKNAHPGSSRGNAKAFTYPKSPLDARACL